MWVNTGTGLTRCSRFGVETRPVVWPTFRQPRRRRRPRPKPNASRRRRSWDRWCIGATSWKRCYRKRPATHKKHWWKGMDFSWCDVMIGYDLAWFGSTTGWHDLQIKVYSDEQIMSKYSSGPCIYCDERKWAALGPGWSFSCCQWLVNEQQMVENVVMFGIDDHWCVFFVWFFWLFGGWGLCFWFGVRWSAGPRWHQPLNFCQDAFGWASFFVNILSFTQKMREDAPILTCAYFFLNMGMICQFCRRGDKCGSWGGINTPQGGPRADPYKWSDMGPQ